ncbi:MAG: hypothetical protein JWR74_105 [Polaromonas sp.]|nr:hypothetical protein [Polaromonas sp.]
MKQHQGATGLGKPHDLIAALFEFEALPGRYPLTLREPRMLFERSRDVMLLASGRAVKGLALDFPEIARVQRAACFFVRTALLRPGADHYTLMGLEPGFLKEDQRDHYRMLMRLTHPDFARASGAWPSDAATRINQANDVLASVMRRAEYDQSRAISGTGKMPVDSLAVILPRPVERKNSAKRGWTLASMGVGAIALTLTHWPDSMEDSHPPQVALLNFPAAATQIAPIVPAKLVQAEKDAQAAKLAQAAKDVQAAKLAQAAKDAEAAKLAQAAKEAQAARLAQAEKNAQSAKLAQVEKDAQAAKLAQAAKYGQTAKLAQAAKDAQAAKLARAPLIEHESHAAIAARSVQASGLAPENPVAPAVVAAVSFKPPVSTLALPSSPSVSDSVGRPSMVDVQPALNRLIQAMQAGRGEELLHGLDRSLRQSRGAADLVNAYNFLVGGCTAVRLGPVQLRSRPSADQLAVDGVVQLVLQDHAPPSPVRELRLRALFSQRDGQVVMTELSAGGFRP